MLHFISIGTQNPDNRDTSRNVTLEWDDKDKVFTLLGNLEHRTIILITQDLIDKIQNILNNEKNKVKLSKWLTISGHCSMRIIEGSDPQDVANRYAFIEKTPRVRIKPFDYEAPAYDFRNWLQDAGGGHSPEYGEYELARQWCDEQLLTMGYELL
jgi:hypothetical protein